MANNVVRALGDGLAQAGMVTLRFNYRGMGGSQGPALDLASHLAEFWHTSHVEEEVDFAEDAAAAAGFLRDTVGTDLPGALLGYSFGCSLLPPLARCDETAPLVLIAPTIGTHDYAAHETLPNPLLVIASENDFAVDAGRLRRWFERLRAPKRLLQAPLDNHFFRGHESWLVETVATFLQEQGGTHHDGHR
jgi:alpha/beta superfamily hydrolase